MSTHPCAFCGLDQEIPAGRHDHAQLCITALRAALAARDREIESAVRLTADLNAELSATRAALAEARRERDALVRGITDLLHEISGDDYLATSSLPLPALAAVVRRQVAALAEARRALEDAIFAAEWAMAKMDRGDGVLEYTGTIAEGDEAKRRLDRSRAALGRPAPDGETHSAT